MPLGVGSGLWAAILPLDEINLSLNPSYEFGTMGVVAIQSATIGTSSAFQRYGAWSLAVTPNSNGTSGALSGTFTTGNGTAYSVGAWIRADAGVPMRMAIGSNNGLGLTSGSVTFTGGGTWHWYNCGLVEAAQGNRSVVIQKTSGASVAPFYVDGLRISPWADGVDRITTYFDGDTGGGTWLGAQQNSISIRTGQYRSGGSVIALADLGLQVDQMPGAGVPPIENSAQSYAVTDGAQFQRQRAASRKFTLTAKPIVGTSLGDFHVTRRTLWDVFKPDLVTPQQPIRFLYVGGQGTMQIDAYYEKGLELGNMDGPIAENAAISFSAYDPYWYSPTQQGTTLAPRASLGSINFMARRSPLGKWGTMGQTSGTTIQSNVTPTSTGVDDMLINAGGTVIIGGFFGSVAGTFASALAQYYPQTNLFGTFTGGSVGFPGAQVTTLAITPSGTLFFGGNFGTVAGTVYPRIGQNVNGAWGTLPNGTIDNTIQKILFNPFGTLFVGGAFSLAAGSTARFLAQHANGSWGTINQQGGTIGASVRSLAWGLDNKSLYVGGGFKVAGGTAAIGIAQLVSGSWGTMQSGANGGGTLVLDLAPKQDGRIATAGDFITLGGGTTNYLGEWNGVQFQADGLGLNGYVRNVFVRNDNSLVLSGSFQLAGSINIPDNLAIWNGASYIPLDIDLPAGADIFSVTQSNDNTLYIGGVFSGTGYAASVGTIVNSGRAIAYPNLRLRNLSAGTARAFQLLNTTTNTGVYFNYTLLGGEQAHLVLQPGARSFQSNVRGNVINTILPGSNLATLNLLPGTNYISFFADNDSLEVSLYWTTRSWSIDGGTIQ